jgi:hypothetical protein
MLGFGDSSETPNRNNAPTLFHREEIPVTELFANHRIADVICSERKPLNLGEGFTVFNLWRYLLSEAKSGQVVSTNFKLLHRKFAPIFPAALTDHFARAFFGQSEYFIGSQAAQFQNTFPGICNFPEFAIA